MLLILAGVTIATLTGNNGILTRTQEAKNQTEEAKEDELRKLTQAEAATYLEEHEYTDISGEKITIPAKCAVSQVEEEKTIKDGLVIIDANGNEWVWIEVPNDGTGPDYTDVKGSEDYTNIESALKAYTEEYREYTYDDIYYSENGLTESEYSNLKQTMLKSIYENGGFFIGRYETGIKNSFRHFDTYDIEYPITENPVIQANAYPYTWISARQAQILASTMNLENCTSSLLFGVQWDLVLKYLENASVQKGMDLETIQTELKDDSTNWGNYSNALYSISNINAMYSIDNGATWKKEQYNKTKSETVFLTSGADKIRNSKQNICDLAGNVWEWTLESRTNLDYPCVYRGGVADTEGFVCSASSHSGRKNW